MTRRNYSPTEFTAPPKDYIFLYFDGDPAWISNSSSISRSGKGQNLQAEKESCTSFVPDITAVKMSSLDVNTLEILRPVGKFVSGRNLN